MILVSVLTLRSYSDLVLILVFIAYLDYVFIFVLLLAKLAVFKPRYRHLKVWRSFHVV